MFPHHIVIINDEPRVRSLLRFLLMRAKPHSIVTVTADRQRGLLAYKQRGADLVIIDSNSLLADSQMLIQQIKAQHDDIPILVVSDDPSIWQQALAAGATGVLPTPVTQQQIERILVELELLADIDTLEATSKQVGEW